MAALSTLLMLLIVTAILFVIAALPLYWAVRVMGGKATLLKTILIQLVAGLATALIRHYLTLFGGIVAFLVLIWIYHEAFRLKWWKAFVAWLLVGVFTFLLGALLVALGIATAALALLI